MVTLGGGATVQVTEQIASLGSNLLMVCPGQAHGPGPALRAPAFDLDDARPSPGNRPVIAGVAPISGRSTGRI